MSLNSFHPVLRSWFENNLGKPTDAQLKAWSAIQAGRHTLIAAPTGSGKTLAAFYAVINELVLRSLENDLPPETQVVYVSPLKALSNDIHRNLEVPLSGIKESLPDVHITIAVRTGDTAAGERQKMLKRPPHILVTTPESLYLLLTSGGGRAMLSSVRTLIVDEIHAMVGDKRGSHLALSVERLASLTKYPLQRIGLSATQKPVELVAKFLVGNRNLKKQPSRKNFGSSSSPNGSSALSPPKSIARDLIAGFPPNACGTDNPDDIADCVIVDTGHRRKLDLRLEIPKSPLSAVMSNEVWSELHERLVELISQHKTTLVFVNTRRLAERLARALAERIGEAHVSSHHGSMSKEHRQSAERRLKAGELKVLVATASMELGIDIGAVELVVQFSSPKRIASFLQRVGRSGHSVTGTPKGILFPLTRDELVEGAALLDSVRRGELDHILMPEEPLDILSQQIVAEVSSKEWETEALFELFRGAYPYRNLTREKFIEIIRMLSEGFTTRRGRRGTYLHYDAVNGKVRARRGARLAALTNGGAIPDMFDYEVILQPEGITVGTLNEDFALESLSGDIFTLGTHAWQIIRVEGLKVLVHDAAGKQPTIPFWLGESSARSMELSESLSRLRVTISGMLDAEPLSQRAEHRESSYHSEERSDEESAVNSKQIPATKDQRVCRRSNGGLRSAQDDKPITVIQIAHPAVRWLVDEVKVDPAAAEQIVLYLWMGKTGLGVMPSHETLVMERFFDETGDMHLVIHSPYGSRVNRGWGLALRKKFCRKFNFELQAAATENSIILSLSSSHSFPLEEVFHYLHSKTVRDTLIQAMIDAPLFEIRWRWNATRSLAILRNRGGKRVPPQFQRMQSEDLIAQVFPDQIACFENLKGEVRVPDHPLVNQVIHDCLTEAMDIDELEELIKKIERKEIGLVAKDLREPSAFAQEIINARPYAFLDDTEFAERRTNAVRNRSWLDPSEASDLSRLDPQAIARVREEAWPEARNADELHDALMIHGFMTEEEGTQMRSSHRKDDADPFPTEGGRVKDEGAGWGDFFSELITQGRAARLHVRKDLTLWIAAERLTMFEAVYKDAQCKPALKIPETMRDPVTREDALREIMRGRLEALGPVTVSQLARESGLDESSVSEALLALEHEGFVFRGKFTPDLGSEEWCERRLLQRIHRGTMDSLRRSIEPVSIQDYMRYLFSLHQMDKQEGSTGPETLQNLLEQLEGFEAPAAAWETELIPSRMEDYDPVWLDVLCISGKIVWGRFNPPKAGPESGKKSGPVKNTPMTLVSRADVDLWRRLSHRETAEPELSQTAKKVRAFLENRGASFFADIASGAGLLPSQAEEGIAELVANGLAASDSYAGLRALLTPKDNRPSTERGGSRRRRHSKAIFGIEHAGRWTLVHNAPVESEEKLGYETIEKVIRVYLKRWGVLFRTIMEKESFAPPWRDVVRVLRRMELRGELRGGRFITQVSGEQYTLPETLDALRKIRSAAKDGKLISISGTDPLNLLGILLPGKRISRITSNRILFRDGIPLAVLENGETKFLENLPESERWAVQKALLRGKFPPKLRYYLGKNYG